MGRLVSLGKVIIVVFLAGCFFGCGSSSPVISTTTYQTPVKVTLSPTPSSSLELGKTLTFTASATNASNSSVNTPISYESSNTSILTVSTAGVACAGSWDSLAAPTVCTPGAVGEATLTAVAQGISSPPTTVYVHQHVDSVVVEPQAGQPPPSASCFSKGQTFNYQATAYSRQGGPAPGLDITASVGPFSWQAVSAPQAKSAKPKPETPRIACLI